MTIRISFIPIFAFTNAVLLGGCAGYFEELRDIADYELRGNSSAVASAPAASNPGVQVYGSGSLSGLYGYSIPGTPTVCLRPNPGYVAPGGFLPGNQFPIYYPPVSTAPPVAIAPRPVVTRPSPTTRPRPRPAPVQRPVPIPRPTAAPPRVNRTPSRTSDNVRVQPR